MPVIRSYFRDYSRKIGSVRVFVNYGLTALQLAQVTNRIRNMSIGVNYEAWLITSEYILGGPSTPPTNKFAKRELKFRCHYTDTVNGKGYEFSIPCAKMDLVIANTDMVDLTTGAGLNLKTSFDAYCMSELENPVVLNSIELTGRNSR